MEISASYRQHHQVIAAKCEKSTLSKGREKLDNTVRLNLFCKRENRMKFSGFYCFNKKKPKSQQELTKPGNSQERGSDGSMKAQRRISEGEHVLTGQNFMTY